MHIKTFGNIYTEYLEIQEKYNREFKEVKKGNEQKLQHLLNHRLKEIKVNTDKWIKNPTTIKIPPTLENILALGPKFYLPANPTDLNMPRYLADIEHILKDVLQNEKDYNLAVITISVTNQD